MEELNSLKREIEILKEKNAALTKKEEEMHELKKRFLEIDEEFEETWSEEGEVGQVEKFSSDSQQEILRAKQSAEESFNKRLTELQGVLNEKDDLIQAKDQLISELQNVIDKKRISNQFRSLFSLSNVRNFLQSLRLVKHWRMHRNAYKIRTYIRKNYDHSRLTEEPKVSIIIPNRNGLDNLKKLFANLLKNTIYTNYEIMVFDNNSSDDSIKYLKSIKGCDIRIIENRFNDTFSSANNKAASDAKGELLLFLNNDVMPFYGWLNQMVKTYLSLENVGLVGSKLIYPKNHLEKDSLKVQHNGIGFKSERGFIRPFNLDNKKDFWQTIPNQTKSYPSVTAACALVGKRDFDQVGGFDENYNYGYEDVDIGLKFHSLGKSNHIAPGALLYHNEFGTQKKQEKKEVKNRRLKNTNHFRDKWYRYLLELSWQDKLQGLNDLHMQSSTLTVGITVTEQGEFAQAGDFFTANELAIELKKLGYQIRYYARKEENWYEIHHDVDVLLVLLHGYDLRKINTSNSNLIKIAWMRNWFDKFSETDWFEDFDLVFSSSKKACEYIENKKRKKAYYMPIATNQDRFCNVSHLKDENFQCDYCFTGSYWNDPRDIVKMLNPNEIPQFKFHIYGKNWGQVENLGPFSKGFLKYQDIPKAYANTKLLIDDANRVTKPWGSVNSRVFDALMSGVLVITNGALGSEDAFDGKLPVYGSALELKQLVTKYLENENLRINKVKELQEIVKSNHTYKHRAITFRDVLKDYYKKSISIKIAVPKMEVAHEWGDYHFALSLQREFEKIGYRTEVRLLHEWDDVDSYNFSSTIVLRGLNKYNPKKFQHNTMWNISHPYEISLEEYRSFDHVFVASKKWTNYLKNQGLDKVSTLLQCTNPDIFKIPTKNERVANEIFFVGNSRGRNRKIIKDILPTKYSLSIYGSGWEDRVDQDYVKGKHIDNEDLYKYYGGAKVVLNDHWDDMKEKGFISNRIFDALACGAAVISDNVEGIHELFGNSVITYKTPSELHNAVSEIMNGKKSVPQSASQRIREDHSFQKRAYEILNIINC